MESVQRREHIEERATRRRGEKQPLRGQLAPRDDLPRHEQQAQGEREIQAGQPGKAFDGRGAAPWTGGDPSARPFERAAAHEEDERVEVQDAGQ